MAVRISRHESVTELHLGRRLLNRQPEFAPLVIARLDLLRILAQKPSSPPPPVRVAAGFTPCLAHIPSLKPLLSTNRAKPGKALPAPVPVNVDKRRRCSAGCRRKAGSCWEGSSVCPLGDGNRPAPDRYRLRARLTVYGSSVPLLLRNALAEAPLFQQPPPTARIALFQRRSGLNAIEAKMAKRLAQLAPGDQHLELLENPAQRATAGVRCAAPPDRDSRYAACARGGWCHGSTPASHPPPAAPEPARSRACWPPVPPAAPAAASAILASAWPAALASWLSPRRLTPHPQHQRFCLCLREHQRRQHKAGPQHSRRPPRRRSPPPAAAACDIAVQRAHADAQRLRQRMARHRITVAAQLHQIE